jgi:hypothetical protein
MKRSKLTIDNNSPLTFPQSMTKFIPVNAALKALSAAGHDVSKKVYYSISQDSSDGSRKCYFMTIPRIRVWAERNKVI